MDDEWGYGGDRLKGVLSKVWLKYEKLMLWNLFEE